MGGYRVEQTDDAARALDTMRPFLLSRPVDHHFVLALLEQRKEASEAGRYWWAAGAEGNPVGLAFLSPLDFYTELTPMPSAAVPALVEAMAADAPGLRGAHGEARTVAAFGGAWSERTGSAVAPMEAHRLYRLDRAPPVPHAPGGLRRATAGDEEVMVAWARAFESEVGLPHPGDVAEATVRRIAAGGLWVWDDGGPVSAVGVTAALAGVSRVHYVYTPPEHRRRGYATACVAAVSARSMGTVAKTCVLYAQLNNPTANRIYRALGYRAAMEVLLYEFGSRRT